MALYPVQYWCNMTYINNNLSKKISRDELIKVAGVPSATFYKIFRQATGLSPIEYIIRLRISKAAEILTENHHIPITEVALETDLKGFDRIIIGGKQNVYDHVPVKVVPDVQN